MKKLDYKTYFDKVYGCFLGKTVIGTLGAPFEGVKMPLELPFKPEMINTLLPNDDLDLQVIWYDVVKKHGEDFTSYDILRAFCEKYPASSGEYAVMRKNYSRGIFPPYSGEYCNDFYIEGMGCPIRSEIWACLSPFDPTHAADLSERDGVIDHKGNSVYSERFFAALESAAFFESDLLKLIDIGLKEVPENCKFRDLVNDTLSLCEKYDDVKLILRKILFKYGHPDCTNLYENIAITLIALLKGDMDMIKTGMLALNCGFDTDCTCATAGAIIGLIDGAEKTIAKHGYDNIRFKLDADVKLRSDRVSDLSEDIALLGVALNPDMIENAPDTDFDFEPSSYPLVITAHYQDGMPCMYPKKPCKVTLEIKNISDGAVASQFSLKGKGVNERFSLAVGAGESASYEFYASVDGEDIIYDKNIYSLYYTVDGATRIFDFGVAGAQPWRVIGPVWRTDPVCTTELLQQNELEYRKITHAVEYDGDMKDVSRRFHLNFAIDTETEYMSHDDCFRPARDTRDTEYEETVYWQTEDTIRMTDLFGFKGPCTAYLAKKLVSPYDIEVCAQIGHSAPFSLWINGEHIASRDYCDQWTAENVHVQNIKLKKGENTVLFRLTRANEDAKFNLFFSDGPSCTAHFTCFGSVDPDKF